MGGIHNRIIQLVFIYSAWSTILLISVAAPQFVQGIADSLFSPYIPYAQFRLALFDAIPAVPALLAAFWAIKGVHGHGYMEGKVDGQG